MFSASPDEAEWLETDGLGGFASGTVSGIRTRRYHALLLAATTPPTGRVVLVNGFEAWIETPSGKSFITSQRYAPDVVYPDGSSRITSFSHAPWPRWIYRIDDEIEIGHGVVVGPGRPTTNLYWRFLKGAGRLCVRLLFSGRDYHSLHHENSAFNFTPEPIEGGLVYRPYRGIPPITIRFNGAYLHQPEWYRNFLYTEERARGLDDCEDLASPGVLQWEPGTGEAFCILSANVSVGTDVEEMRDRERTRRTTFISPLHRAADSYIVRRGTGKTVIAGYPWFTDWGRDTFIALRGLCIAGWRLNDGREILLEWAGAVSQGMLPNRFADHGETAEYNAVDASLWFIVAAYELTKTLGTRLQKDERERLARATQEILSGYTRGTRYQIRADNDGLLACGEHGVQLTWMDAKVGDWVVTPRIGKPVEVQALWINALKIGAQTNACWSPTLKRAQAAFATRFWNEERGFLHDVVDVDHRPGTDDSSFRPNQILAIGGLPFVTLEGEHARKVVDAVEAHLLTPFGLRSLAPNEPGYHGRYEGGARDRDAAYHQGTVWPWLMGPFIEAWVRVRGDTRAARRDAQKRFLEPLLSHLMDKGLGHLPEIADADQPHATRGCPFQAWSVGEALRIQVWLDERPT
jgi:predicted glycogen debranching enzyme